MCEDSEKFEVKSQNFKCFVDYENFFLKKEILSKNPDVFIIYEVFSEEDREDIIKNAKKNKLMHMFEIYEDYLEDLEVDKVNINHKYAEKNFTSQDFKTLSQSLHFGREGKLYFPEIGSEENILIESKLEKYQIIKQDNKKTTANLQVNLFSM